MSCRLWTVIASNQRPYPRLWRDSSCHLPAHVSAICFDKQWTWNIPSGAGHEKNRSVKRTQTQPLTVLETSTHSLALCPNAWSVRKHHCLCTFSLLFTLTNFVPLHVPVMSADIFSCLSIHVSSYACALASIYVLYSATKSEGKTQMKI